MRSLSGIVLILTLTVPFLGAWHFFSAQLKQIRNEAKEIMDKAYPEGSAVYFEFTFSESRSLKWEHESEFEYRGEMYDVLRKKTSGGKVQFWCYWDRKETVLRKEFHEFLVNAFSGPNRDHKSEMQFSIFLKTLYSNSISILQPVEIGPLKSDLTSWVSLNLPCVYIPPIPDPPESAFII